MQIRRIEPRTALCHKPQVAAYARVSTDMTDQLNSYETQMAHYRCFITANADWDFAGVYAEQGRSGTNANKRPAFLKMMQDSAAGKIDLILCKSISRFARNVADAQSYCKQLKAIHVEVRFEEGNISSFDPAADFLFSVLATVAQEESRSISENVKWAHQRRCERGEYRLGSNRIFGYDMDPTTGKLTPNKQAWLVRLIFQRFASGTPLHLIADEMNALGCKRLRSRRPVDASMLRSILRNETYVGDKLLQKTAPRDFLTKRPDPHVAYTSYYLTDDHAPIVPRATWEAAQARLCALESAHAHNIHRQGRPHHPFYGKLICGCCGHPYTRRTFSAHGISYKAWNCSERQKGKHGNGCKNPMIRETVLESIIAQQMGWGSFNPAAFERTISRVLISPNGVKVMQTNE